MVRPPMDPDNAPFWVWVMLIGIMLGVVWVWSVIAA